ncbi:FkbM family methyltransferase [Vibrio sp. PP-XX7]
MEQIDNLFVVGFEPDEREYKNLVNTSNQKWFNIGLNHSKGKFPLYITGYQTNTSLYKPNLAFTNELCYGDNDFKIEKEIEVECDTLDNILKTNNLSLDYIKLDTQGSELDILKGGILALEKDIFAVEAEVEFNELYQNQPMFADVDSFLRAQRYILME